MQTSAVLQNQGFQVLMASKFYQAQVAPSGNFFSLYCPVYISFQFSAIQAIELCSSMVNIITASGEFSFYLNLKQVHFSIF